MTTKKANKKLTLKSPISKLKGFGKKKVAKAHKLGITSVKDLLTYFPFRYNDYRPHDLENTKDKAQVSVIGTVFDAPHRKYHGRMNTTTFHIAYDHYQKSVLVTFFNQAWMVHHIHKNQKVFVYGQYHRNGALSGINGRRIEVIKDGTKKAVAFKPIYSTTKGVKQYDIQKMVKAGYDQCHSLIHEVVPKSIRDKYELEDEATVIHDMQFPTSEKKEKLARRTAKFNEFYTYELRIQKLKQKRTKSKGIAIHYDKHTLRHFDNSLPFSLTEGQLRSVYEIVTNLHDGTKMNRLLQGDVGSGKTVVAAFGILATISAGYQTAIMIPTSVLGEQHYKSFSKMFKGLGVNILLITGGMKPKDKATADNKIASGEAQLVIGTDALIQPDVKFKKLGLAVIDEQHKFGVDQREALINKGKGVNALAMTATPIPRTLAITSYGDMDVSIIDSLPKGRKPVLTRWLHRQSFDECVPFITGLLAKGQQAYCVVPLVKQTDTTEANDDKVDALTAYHHLKQVFAPYRVGLLHGRMDDDEKDKILHDFKSGDIQMLVSTTVVEVGVDASNATMMIIFNADNFGLSTLHQLRGRVGRNSLQSYCLLIANPRTQEGRKRMKVMEKTNNGFVVSQYDLQLRGSGDVFGSEQSGVPKFKTADPIADSTILEYARNEAIKQASSKKKAF